MSTKKKEHLRIMHYFFLLLVLIIFFSLLSFSFQIIYSDNISVETISSYGTYQNGFYWDSGNVAVPSPFAVKKTAINVKNAENSTRILSVSLKYSGTNNVVIPSGELNDTAINWNAHFLPYEEKTFVIIGRNLEIKELWVYAVAPTVIPSNLTLVLPAIPNKTEPIFTFGYTIDAQNTEPGFFRQIFDEEKKLNIAAKSILLSAAGLVVLTIIGGFASVFSTKEKIKTKKTGIHTGDFYHNAELGGFAKYRYEESEYWK